MKRTTSNRFKALLLLAALSFVLVEYKLVRLQVVEHDFWYRESCKNLTRPRLLPFERGWILDRDMTPLALTQSVFELRFVFRNFRKESPAGQLSMILLLSERRSPVWEVDRVPLGSIYEDPEAFLERVLSHEAADFLNLQSRKQRQDLFTYFAWLFDLKKTERETLFGSTGSIPGPLGDVPFLAAKRGLVADRIREEKEAFDGFEAILNLDKGRPLSLTGVVEDEAYRADRRVRERLAGGSEEVPTYLRFRKLHWDIDSIERTISQDIGHRAAIAVSLQHELYPGFEIVETTKRYYPEENDTVCPLLIGKIGKPGPERIRPWKEHQKRLTELALIENKTEGELIEEENLRLLVQEFDVRPEEEVGAMGLEAFFEPILRGRRGYILEERAPHNRTPEILQFIPPIRGKDVVLTIDIAWQRACEEVLDRIAQRYGEAYPAAVVIMEVKTGAVRAMATTPRPGRKQLSRQKGWERILADPKRPLMQRTVMNYNLPPPGSVFKLVTAVAALEEGICTPEENIDCPLRIPIGDIFLHCEGLHGPTDMRKAIVKSCNIYFYRVGDQLGYPNLFKWAERFGFGRATGLLDRTRYGMAGGVKNILREQAGFLKKDETGRANRMRLAIGQGAIDDVTPIQVARMVAGIATGRLPAPHLVERIGNEPFEPPPPEDLGIRENTLLFIRKAMEQVVDEGTAAPNPEYDLDLRPYGVAGKTGTPQTIPALRNHACFAGYWPRSAPRYSFAVFVEFCGLHGGEIAAPVMNRILEAIDPRGSKGRSGR